MDCQEIPEGYKVMYTPMAPGNYLIGVKYGGPNHISRSPFKAKVTGNEEPLCFFSSALQSQSYKITDSSNHSLILTIKRLHVGSTHADQLCEH
jgi:hypothetical protein